MHIKHYSDDSLLTFLDGEGRGWERFLIKRRLERCWQCRTRLADLETQIHSLTRAWNDAITPDSQWLAESKLILDARIRQYERKRGGDAGFQTMFRNIRIPMVALAGVLLMLAAAIRFVNRGHQGTASRLQLAARIQASVDRFATEPLHQEFDVEVTELAPVNQHRSERLSVWSQPSSGKYSSRLISTDGRLQYAVWHPASGSVYAYDAATSRLLRGPEVVRERTPIFDLSVGAETAEAFQKQFLQWLERRRWHPLALLSEAAMFSSEDGYLMSFQPAREGETRFRMAIHKAETTLTMDLLLQAEGDRWKPAVQRIRVESPKRSFELVLRTAALAVLPQAQLLPALFEPDTSLFAGRKRAQAPKLPLAPKEPEAAAARVVNPLELEQTEIEARYALHRVRACLDEPVQIVRDGSRQHITIQGRVASSERKAELLSSLAGVRRPWLTIDILTEAEAMQLAESQIRDRESVKKIRAYGQISSDTFPMRNALVRYVERRRDDQRDPQWLPVAEQVNGLANQIFLDSRHSMAEAWALRRLAGRYPDSGIAGLTPSARWLVEIMLRDHLQDLQSATFRMRGVLLAVLGAGHLSAPDSATGQAGRGIGSIETLFTAVQHIAQEVEALFAGSRPAALMLPAGAQAASVEETVSRLIADLANESQAEAAAREALAVRGNSLTVAAQ
jgi:hypothetical protein